MDADHRKWLVEIAQEVDQLGSKCADSVTVVLTGGETITYTAGNTWVNVPGERPEWLAWQEPA